MDWNLFLKIILQVLAGSVVLGVCLAGVVAAVGAQVNDLREHYARRRLEALVELPYESRERVQVHL